VSRPNTTVVVLAGRPSPGLAERLGTLPGVTTVPDERASSLRDIVFAAQSPYVVHGLDPLHAVGEAWAGYFDGTVPAGTLEVAIEAALASLRGDDAMLPDYYLVADAERLPTTQRHWWLGALASVAPSRVVPVAPHVGDVVDALRRLPAGRWWPEPADAWLRGLPHAVPDRVGLGIADVQTF
jgi:hypothetical protein